MLEWLLYSSILWLSLDIIIVATVWYLTSTVKPRYPNWWKRVVVDEELRYSQAISGLLGKTE